MPEGLAVATHQLGLAIRITAPRRLGLFDRLDVGVAVPLVLVQAGDDPAQLQPEALRAACVIHGSPETVARKILELREEVGHFGTLLYAAHDWQEPVRMKRSMRLMAQEVMPRINGALRDKAA